MYWRQSKLIGQSIKKNVMKAWGEKLMGRLGILRPNETILGNCGTNWSINIDKSWNEEEETKV